MRSQILVCYDAQNNAYSGTKRITCEPKLDSEGPQAPPGDNPDGNEEWWLNFRHEPRRGGKSENASFGQESVLVAVVQNFSFDDFEEFLSSMCRILEFLSLCKCVDHVFFRLQCKSHPLHGSIRSEETGATEVNANAFANVLRRKLATLEQAPQNKDAWAKHIYLRFFSSEFRLENLEDEIPPCRLHNEPVGVWDLSNPWLGVSSIELNFSEFGMQQALQSFRKSDQLATSFIASQEHASPISKDVVKALVPNSEFSGSMLRYSSAFKSLAAAVCLLLLQSLQLNLLFLDMARSYLCYYVATPILSRISLLASSFSGGPIFDKQPWCLTFSKLPGSSVMTGNYARTYAMARFEPLPEASFRFAGPRIPRRTADDRIDWVDAIKGGIRSLLAQVHASPSSLGLFATCALIVALQVMFFSRLPVLEDDEAYNLLGSLRNARDASAIVDVLVRLVPSFDPLGFAYPPSFALLCVVFALSRYVKCGNLFRRPACKSEFVNPIASGFKLCLTLMILRQFAIIMPLIFLFLKALAAFPPVRRREKKEGTACALNEMQIETARLLSNQKLR